MRILVVDDEMVSRTKLELIMEYFGECQAVDHGEDALAAFYEAHRDKNPFNLIMLDIDLPGMDGIRLLSAIRNAEKELNIEKADRAKILMTTSYRDKDRIVASIQSGCDDYIGKPFDLNLIRDKLSKLGIKERNPSTGENEAGTATPTTTDQLYGEIVALINKNQTDLPSLPKIYVRFREMMARKATFSEIVGLLKKDIAIAAEIIRRSNSAYYKGFATNTSLEQAVARMGYDAIVQVVTELSIRKFFTMKIEKYRSLIENLWKHSISSAYAADFISKLLKIKLQGDPFLAALLHDIGKMALMQIIADMERKGKFKDGIHPIMLVTILEDYHCQLGARLLEKWKFAECFIHTTLHHNSPDPTDAAGAQAAREMPYRQELMVVKFASQTANLMGYDILASGPADIDLTDAVPIQQLNLKPERIAETMAQVTERMKEVQDLF
ncbi:MAG: HDOD domain-containing protein [Desulfobacterales bacterium]|nr:MAG: HDOD domain-containing protein [Desulfobacterales bacterium]